MLNIKNAYLVSLSISTAGLLGERKDKDASRLVTSTYGTTSRAAKASKFLIDRSDKSVKAVVAAAQQARLTFYRFSFAFEGTMRMIPSQASDDFDTAIAADVKAFDAAVIDYARNNYPRLYVKAEHDLGQMFDRSQYPSASALESMFNFSLTKWPMPQGSNFMADIAETAANNAKASIETALNDRFSGAFADLIGRVEQNVAHYVDKVAAYTVKANGNGKEAVDGIFRDSLVENVRDIAKLARKLNLWESPEIELLASRAEMLATVSADSLRASDNTRQTQVTQGKNILAQIEAIKSRSQVRHTMAQEHADTANEYGL